MIKASTIAAYVAWVLALAAILMPPALAHAGIETVAGLEESIFALVGDEPEPLVLAVRPTEKDGWQA